MVTATIDRERGELNISYPAGFSKKNEVLKVSSNVQAENLWRLKQRLYMKEVLSKFLRQRQYALAMTLTAQQYHAMANIHFVIKNYYEGKNLKRFAQKIIMLEDSIMLIAPTSKSRFYKHFNNTILPLLKWCKYFNGIPQ
ncbi:hypothetical protein [Sphingobacterium spiritivorum]|uniref:hypothetical protein n=1 Tax=Sphingobacterium spiritivorum TaxID=258 RepID=UPI003DA66F5B